ncbi:hypothetical protein BC940DRAFT_316232 [Gongronella butleri]|nr:hypothetical protein BC940DRAFT_316232 [Gongronella butleri]
MDFTDLFDANVYGNTVVYPFYVATMTVNVLVLAFNLRTVYFRTALTLPYSVISVALIAGLIFRALSLYILNFQVMPDLQVGIFSGMDRPRTLFYTFSALAVFLLPVIVAHDRTRRATAAAMAAAAMHPAPPLPRTTWLQRTFTRAHFMLGVFYSCYVFAVASIACNIAWLVLSQKVDVLQVFHDNLGRELDQYAWPDAGWAATKVYIVQRLMFWWFIAAYIAIAACVWHVFPYTYWLYCGLNLLSIIVISIITFDGNLYNQRDILMSNAWIYLQFIFLLILPLLNLLIASLTGHSWVRNGVKDDNNDEIDDGTGNDNDEEAARHSTTQSSHDSTPEQPNQFIEAPKLEISPQKVLTVPKLELSPPS